MNLIRVMLVDDQAMVRAGFRMLLEVESDITIVAEAADGGEADRLVEAAKPDVILMDVQMPGVDGLEAAGRIIGRLGPSGPRIVMLTTFELDDYIFEALRIGASGFLLKNAPPEDLVDAIRVVAGGDALLHPSVTRTVIGSFAGRNPGSIQPPTQLGTLTEREHQVLMLLARGLTNSEIAAELILGEATIKTYVSSVLAKLSLRDRVQAVVFAYEHGLIEPGT